MKLGKAYGQSLQLLREVQTGGVTERMTLLIVLAIVAAVAIIMSAATWMPCYHTGELQAVWCAP
jgi:hypothetical protein